MLAHWDQLVCDSERLSWVTELMGWEETERERLSGKDRSPASAPKMAPFTCGDSLLMEININYKIITRNFLM